MRALPNQPRALPSQTRALPNQTRALSNQTSGAEGTGHHFVTAVMMRLSQLMPMTLVQEQMFQSLWWKPGERSPATFWGALEAFFEWVQVRHS